MFGFGALSRVKWKTQVQREVKAESIAIRAYGERKMSLVSEDQEERPRALVDGWRVGKRTTGDSDEVGTG